MLRATFNHNGGIAVTKELQRSGLIELAPLAIIFRHELLKIFGMDLDELTSEYTSLDHYQLIRFILFNNPCNEGLDKNAIFNKLNTELDDEQDFTKNNVS